MIRSASSSARRRSPVSDAGRLSVIVFRVDMSLTASSRPLSDVRPSNSTVYSMPDSSAECTAADDAAVRIPKSVNTNQCRRKRRGFKRIAIFRPLPALELNSRLSYYIATGLDVGAGGQNTPPGDRVTPIESRLFRLVRRRRRQFLRPVCDYLGGNDPTNHQNGDGGDQFWNGPAQQIGRIRRHFVASCII